ncbi:MAG: ferredoxin [Rhodocyclaceae bacterium]|nr:MAG: ferredoxin [Rhodocyclaceae bacterium]
MTTAELIDATPGAKQDAAIVYQRALQNSLLLAGVFLVGALLFRPAVGLVIMWNILIPTAPALIVVAPGLWRNICPMATLSLLPRRLGLSRKRIPSRRWTGLLGLTSVSALFLIVPLRHILLNTSGSMTALMLLLAAGIAVATGIAFEWRSGWCTSLCPIHPVEKLYGLSPPITVKNMRCDSCRKCTAICPDSIRSMTPVVTGPSALDRWVGHGFTGSFVGFIFGWYQVPDYPGHIGAVEIAAGYLWPFGCAAVSLLLYAATRKWLCQSKLARHALIRIFAAAAVSCYYWYRIPALTGFGPYSDTGLLYDLTGVLPNWTPVASRILTTSFFAWFLLLRPSPNTSWMIRPVFDATQIKPAMWQRSERQKLAVCEAQ